MGDDDRNRTGNDRSLKDIARRHNGLFGATDGDDRKRCDLVHAVQEHQDEVLATVVCQNGSDNLCDIGWSCDFEQALIAMDIAHHCLCIACKRLSPNPGKTAVSPLTDVRFKKKIRPPSGKQISRPVACRC